MPRALAALSAWSLVVLVALASVTVVDAHPASADQIADLQTQAKQISQELVQDQLQIDAYQQQYVVATATVATDAQALARLDRQIGADEQQVDADVLDVRRQAVISYMEAGGEASSAGAVLFTGSADTSQLTSEYSAIASGNIETSLDALHLAQRALQAGRVALVRQQALDQSEAALRARALTSAQTTASQLELLQGQVTGQLAAAVSAERAAQTEAAAAALSAARRAQAVEAAGVGTTTADPAGAGAGSGAGSDPALNAYLQCVVQVESGGNYQAVSADGTYMGAFQFSQATWNMAAQAAGFPGLVGVPPNVASKADQDSVAVALYALDGDRPWLGDRCGS
ncbi:MAG TPA: transglycosylase family protein [Acidimicrobiales bacterium]|nr:transglycosylase family protein [Acidimicrobiales bacterium]